LTLWLLSAKGADVDEMMLYFGEPTAVQMRKSTDGDKKKIEEKNKAQAKRFGDGTLALARSKGIQVKKITQQELLKEIGDVL
jgi:hypothetical protein